MTRDPREHPRPGDILCHDTPNGRRTYIVAEQEFTEDVFWAWDLQPLDFYHFVTSAHKVGIDFWRRSMVVGATVLHVEPQPEDKEPKP